MFERLTQRACGAAATAGLGVLFIGAGVATVPSALHPYALGLQPDGKVLVGGSKVHGPNEWWHVDYVGR